MWDLQSWRVRTADVGKQRQHLRVRKLFMDIFE